MTDTDLVDGYYTVGTTNAIDNPLPVELTYFKAQLCEDQVCLEWETSSELNNDYFEIQKSYDSKTWQAIGKVKGNGTINEASFYSYQDNDLLFGTSYYRLKQVDFDGEFSYSPIDQIQYSDITEVSVYPNPSNGEFTISGSHLEEAEICITSLSGRKVSYSKQIVSAHQLLIDLKDNPSGIYFLSIIKNQVAITKRIIYTPNR